MFKVHKAHRVCKAYKVHKAHRVCNERREFKELLVHKVHLILVQFNQLLHMLEKFG